MSSNNYSNTGKQNSSAPQLNSLVVDSCYSSATGIMQYQIMYFANRKMLHTSQPFYGVSNNVGEFLAVYLALKACKKHGSDAVVYTDSTTAISWITKKRVKTNATDNQWVLAKLLEAEDWLRSNPNHNRVEKWQTRLWGENPADFGRK
jgi:ribonuclease HI